MRTTLALMCAALSLVLLWSSASRGEEHNEATENTMLTHQQKLVAEARWAVAEAGIDTCEESAVYLICIRQMSPTEGVEMGHLITSDMTDQHDCTDGWVVCPGPRDCGFGFKKIFAPYPGFFLSVITELRMSKEILWTVSAYDAAPIRLVAPRGGTFLGATPQPIQGHCQDEKAVSLECTEAPWENVLLYEGEGVWMEEERLPPMPRCQNITLVCPHGMACVTALTYRHRVSRGYPSTTSIEHFGASENDSYRFEPNVDDHGGLVGIEVGTVAPPFMTPLLP